MEEAEESSQDPLFIKVSGYREVLQEIEAVRQILANMRESAEVLNEVQRVKERSANVFLENVDRLNEALADIDNNLPELHERNLRFGGGSERADDIIDESVRDLRSELGDLKDEIDDIE